MGKFMENLPDSETQFPANSAKTFSSIFATPSKSSEPDKWTQNNFTSIEYTTISFPLLKQASTRRQILTLTVMIRLQKQFDTRYERLALLAPRLPPLNFIMADYDQKRTHHWKGGGAAVLFPSPGYSNTDNFPHSNPIHIGVQSLRKVFSNQNQYAILERSKIIILKF